MEKAGELEARWRGHVDTWRASGARGPLTLVPAVRVPSAAASTPSLSLHSPQGWRLDFAPLPPAGWLTALWGERA